MEPFPTAFVKALGQTSAPSPDSCLELETTLVEDYTAETINTDKNNGSVSHHGNSGLQTPFVQLDRINGRDASKEKYIKGLPHGDLDNTSPFDTSNGECEFESLNEDVDGDGKVDRLEGYTPVSFLANLKPEFQIDGDIWKWDVVSPICQVEDGPGACYERYVNTIAKSFLYVWMKGTPPLKPWLPLSDPLRYSDSIYKATNRSNPFETSRSEDCKSCTIKLWFEKDGGQKVIELYQDPGSLEYHYGYLEPFESDQFIQEFGYNGYRSPFGSTDNHHYFYKQKATSKVTVTIGSPKTLTISIKGLGMDSNLDIWDIYLDPDKRIKEVLLGYYEPKFENNDPQLNVVTNNNLLQEEEILLEKRENPVEDAEIGELIDRSEYLYNNFQNSRGDLQTFTIDHTVNNTTTPMIKAMAPQLGVFLSDATEENYYKGPVRIFKWDPTKKQYWKGGEVASVGAYTGVGTTNHPINGLGYIPADKFEDDDPLKAIWGTNEEGASQYGGKSPYGTDYYKASSQFYTASNDQPGSFSSPYTYEHEVELGVGEHTFDLVFDSVVEYMNGGAYYDVTFSLGD
jgi:hypothetical protein